MHVRAAIPQQRCPTMLNDAPPSSIAAEWSMLKCSTRIFLQSIKPHSLNHSLRLTDACAIGTRLWDSKHGCRNILEQL